MLFLLLWVDKLFLGTLLHILGEYTNMYVLYMRLARLMTVLLILKKSFHCGIKDEGKWKYKHYSGILETFWLNIVNTVILLKIPYLQFEYRQ